MIRTTGFVVLLAVLALVPGAQAQEKPNIVVIMTDNQGYGDLGAYGGVRAETPRIDQLAAAVQYRTLQGSGDEVHAWRGQHHQVRRCFARRTSFSTLYMP